MADEIKAYDSEVNDGQVSLSRSYGSNMATVVDLTPYQAMQVIAALSTWLTAKAEAKVAGEKTLS